MIRQSRQEFYNLYNKILDVIIMDHVINQIAKCVHYSEELRNSPFHFHHISVTASESENHNKMM